MSDSESKPDGANMILASVLELTPHKINWDTYRLAATPEQNREAFEGSLHYWINFEPNASSNTKNLRILRAPAAGNNHE